MTNLYFIRHAECQHNLSLQYIWGRSNASKLTEKGIQQSLKLSHRLKKEGLLFDKVFCSPAVRTMETASLALEMEYDICSDLQELHQGEWEGKLREQMYTPEIKAKLKEQHYEFAAPGGESQKEVGTRMMRFADWAVEQGESIAVFTHGNAIKCFLHNILQFRPDIIWRIPIENTSITHISYDPVADLWIPFRINDAAHLSLAV